MAGQPAELEWVDGRVRYDIDAVPSIEETTHEGRTVRAYTNQQDTLDDVLRGAVADVPDEPAFVVPETETRVTYAEFDRAVDRLGAGLQRAGVEPGDVVSILLRNELAFVELVFACARVGAIAAPMNTQLTAPTYANIFENARPAAVVAGTGFGDLLRDVEWPLDDRTYTVDGEGGFEPLETLRAAEGDVERVELDGSTPVVALYTSGTTGTPKGCVIDNFNLMNVIGNYQYYFGDDRYHTLVTVPLFHAAGFCTGVVPSVARHGKTVIRDGSSPEEFLETMERERITFYMGVPTHYVLLTDRTDPGSYDLSAWTYAVFGGAPMPERAIERLREALPDVELGNGYGMTEVASGLATYNPDAFVDDRPGSVGLPTPPVELAVLDDDGDRVSPGTIGRLAIRGPFVAREYLNQPEKTGEAFRDGWHVSGDLAVIDRDGFVTLKGRERDRIIRGGENIFPLEVEEALVQHEGVLEAAVTSFPDEVLGERLLACVVPKDDTPLTETDVREAAREHLAEYKRPDVYRLLSELPRNPNGKVEKEALVPEPLRHGIRAADRS